MDASSHEHEWSTLPQETTGSAPNTQRCKCGAVRYWVGPDTAAANGHWVYQVPVRYGDGAA